MQGSDECPRCSGDSEVLETRSSNLRPLLRRRICKLCGLRWSTREVRYTREKKEAARVTVELPSFLHH